MLSTWETPSFGLETNEQILLWFSWTMRGSRLDLQKRQNGEMVGARGFEPPTPWSRTRCATRLRYAPNVCCGEMSIRGLSVRLKHAGGLLDRCTDLSSLADSRWLRGRVWQTVSAAVSQ